MFLSEYIYEEIFLMGFVKEVVSPMPTFVIFPVASFLALEIMYNLDKS